MTDLHDKVRALLALRDKATPGPWFSGIHGVNTGPSWLIRPSVAYEIESENNAAFIAAAHDMADTVADLLAENERLTHALAAQVAATNGASAYAVEQAHRAEAAEAACENLGVTPQQAAEGLARFKARDARIAELEAQYRALCEAEPVAWYSERTRMSNYREIFGYNVPLIPRPSMEGGK